MAGKGDTYRPVNLVKYETNFDNIFRSCPSIQEPREQEENANGVTSCATRDLTHDEDSSSQVEQTLPT
jgi:hypothetical protein